MWLRKQILNFSLCHTAQTRHRVVGFKLLAPLKVLSKRQKALYRSHTQGQQPSNQPTNLGASSSADPGTNRYTSVPDLRQASPSIPSSSCACLSPARQQPEGHNIVVSTAQWSHYRYTLVKEKLRFQRLNFNPYYKKLSGGHKIELHESKRLYE